MTGASRKIAFSALTLLAAGVLTTCGQPALISGFKPVSPLQKLVLGGDWPEVDSVQPTLMWEPFPGVDERPARDLKDIPRKSEPQTDPNGRMGVLKWPFVELDTNRVSDISYELRIWEVQNNSRGTLVYEQRNILNPAHRIETSLKPDTRFLWTVRARFRLDGVPRVTGWSMRADPQDMLPFLHDLYPSECLSPFLQAIDCTVQYAVRGLGDIPAHLLYRFQTP